VESDLSNAHLDKEALLECISIGVEKLYHCERYYVRGQNLMTNFINENSKFVGRVVLLRKSPNHFREKV